MVVFVIILAIVWAIIYFVFDLGFLLSGFIALLILIGIIIIFYICVSIWEKTPSGKEARKIYDKKLEEERKKEVEKNIKAFERGAKLNSLLDTAPKDPNMYNIVTIQDTTLNLISGKYKIWRNEDTINILAHKENNSLENIFAYKFEVSELEAGIKSGKINKEDQIFYSFNVNKISLFERENNEQYIAQTEGGGSHISLWTGNEKIDRVQTTEKKVGSKYTLLYIENNPVDIKIMFDYEDYSVLNRLINK